MPVGRRIVRIPVKLVDGQWELLYGGGVKVKDGAIAELRVEKEQISDPDFLKALTAKSEVKILDETQVLLVAVTIRTVLDDALRKPLVPMDQVRLGRKDWLCADSQLLPVYLAGPTDLQSRMGKKRGGLWLYLEGMEPRSLESGRVKLPEVNGLDMADSLNHAFTLLSESYEPWRKAHTGSIYERVFYPEENGTWYPLNDLRDRALASAERTIIAQLWEDVQKAQGMWIC